MTTKQEIMEVEKKTDQGGDTEQSDTDTDQEDYNLPKEKWGDIIPLNSKKFTPYECVDNEVTIGRNASNMLVIDDKRLSGMHCKLVYDPKER